MNKPRGREKHHLLGQLKRVKQHLVFEDYEAIRNLIRQGKPKVNLSFLDKWLGILAIETKNAIFIPDGQKVITMLKEAGIEVVGIEEVVDEREEET